MSRQPSEFPIITKEPHGSAGTDEVYSHDSFATINVGTVQIGGSRHTLFGSDISHHEVVRIEIKRAQLHRSLSRDWIFGHGRSVIEFEMSHAQFAEFITSFNKGGGTPVTLITAPPKETVSEWMPSIKKHESKHDLHRKEIGQAAKAKIAQMQQEIDRLGAMLETGKTSIKELRDIHKHLGIWAGHLPGTMEFVVKQAEEALEKATSDAKVEVEAYVSATAHRLGLDDIRQLGAMGREPQLPAIENDSQQPR